MNPIDYSPIQYFWAVVEYLGVAPWWFKAGCAWLMVVVVILLPRRIEHWPFCVGLAFVGISPVFPPAGPFGDWLVYPFGAAMLLRHYFLLRPAMKVMQADRGPPPEVVIARHVKQVLTKPSS